MEGNYTSGELAALIAQLEKLFDVVELSDVSQAPETGFSLGRSSTLEGTDLVLAHRIQVDGCPQCLKLRAPVTGSAEPEDALLARERQIYRDDMIRDFLSGAYNRRYWETEFCRKIGSHVASGNPVAVALVKVDNFSSVVKAHGQPVADQLTCYVANLWKRFYDEGNDKVVCRLTGSTYAVGCVGADEVDLENQMRVLYEKMNLTCTATVGMMCRIPFTLSVGCAGTGEVENKVWPELYALCDQRLRAQVAAGGDGVYHVR